jgi:hypothetical protein
MRAKRIAYSVVAGCVALLVAGWCLALVLFSDKGQWPDTWPKELDALREQARTLGIATGIQETVYEIPFTDSEQFEAAWPHILAVKSEGAPLILVRSPSKMIGDSMDAGVRIHCPVGGGGGETSEQGKRLKLGPPWPDDIKSESGVLPEYVVNKDGKWVGGDKEALLQRIKDGERVGFLYRARVDIELVVDGQIVDLNWIPLPPDTPIIDKRFKKKTTPTD